MMPDLKSALRCAAFLTVCGALNGCMSFNPYSLRQMESALRDSNPDMEFASTTKFGVGPMTMNLVDFVFVHDNSVDVSKISRADIGIYALKQPVNVADFRMPPGDARDRDCPRREVILRVMEVDEHVEMAVCMRNDKITGFAIFVLEPREMVVINARGNLEALISSAIRGNVSRKSRQAAARPEPEPVVALVPVPAGSPPPT